MAQGRCPQLHSSKQDLLEVAVRPQCWEWLGFHGHPGPGGWCTVSTRGPMSTTAPGRDLGAATLPGPTVYQGLKENHCPGEGPSMACGRGDHRGAGAGAWGCETLWRAECPQAPGRICATVPTTPAKVASPSQGSFPPGPSPEPVSQSWVPAWPQWNSLLETTCYPGKHNSLGLPQEGFPSLQRLPGQGHWRLGGTDLFS